MPSLPYVSIYSDGACLGNPGPGGWAVLLRFGEREKVLTGSSSSTTNNQMELTAAIRGLSALNQPCRIDFYTDSMYLKKGVDYWMPGWKKNNWQRKSGELKNAGLWQELDAAMKSHKITWHWVKGHVGNPYNERVDRLARQAIKK
jgi:ribonuclease HI